MTSQHAYHVYLGVRLASCGHCTAPSWRDRLIRLAELRGDRASYSIQKGYARRPA